MPKDSHIQERAKKIWEKTRKELVALGHQTVELAQKGEEEVLRYTEIGCLKWEILVLNNKIEKLYSKLGRKVFGLAAEGKIDEPDVVEICGYISGLQEQVQAKNKEVAETKKKNIGKNRASRKAKK